MLKEDTVMEEAKEKEGEKDKEVDDKVKADEKEEELILEAVDATPIQTIPPTVEVTTSPGQTKPSKKRKTRSRK